MGRLLSGFSDSLLSALARLASDHSDIAVLWLYGSRAKGSHHAGSDYDLAAAFVSFPADQEERVLRPAMLALDWAAALGLPEQQLSLIDINLVPVPLAWEVVSSGIILYRDASPRAEKEMLRVSGRMELDILWHRRQFGEI